MGFEPNYRLPRDIGVVEHPTKRTIVVYHLVPAYPATRTYEAHELGNPQLLELTTALRAEIELDLSKRGIDL